MRGMPGCIPQVTQGTDWRLVSGLVRPGVYYCYKSRKWMAQLRLRGKIDWFEECNSEEEAAWTYDRVARKRYGRFATGVLNFPGQSQPPQRKSAEGKVRVVCCAFA
jgi:hypothetical protein